MNGITRIITTLLVQLETPDPFEDRSKMSWLRRNFYANHISVYVILAVFMTSLVWMNIVQINNRIQTAEGFVVQAKVVKIYKYRKSPDADIEYAGREYTTKLNSLEVDTLNVGEYIERKIAYNPDNIWVLRPEEGKEDVVTPLDYIFLYMFIFVTITLLFGVFYTIYIRATEPKNKYSLPEQEGTPKSRRKQRRKLRRKKE